jgi:hypothetical protein
VNSPSTKPVFGCLNSDSEYSSTPESDRKHLGHPGENRGSRFFKTSRPPVFAPDHETGFARMPFANASDDAIEGFRNDHS